MPILTPEERLGQLLSERYRLEAVLSTGGMGVLFRARDEQTETDVAVKMLNPFYSLEQDRVARFVRETRIAPTLQHRYIARVLGVGADENRLPFLVMELLHGCSLQRELDERGVLPFAETVAIALPIAEALAAAHEDGVVHRDVKPGNIFLHRDESGRIVPKLLDFGIAKTHSDQFETKTGVMVGTPEYMAPEQAQGGECGPFTDVWGLAAVLYRCLSGTAPLAGGSMGEFVANLVQGSVPPLRLEGVAKSACATIDRALSRDPHQRYPTMVAFAKALTAAAEREHGDRSTEVLPVLAASSGTPAADSPRRALHRLIAGAGVAMVLGLSWVAFRAEGRPVNAASGPLQRAAHRISAQAALARRSALPPIVEPPATSVLVEPSSREQERSLAAARQPPEARNRVAKPRVSGAVPPPREGDSSAREAEPGASSAQGKPVEPQQAEHDRTTGLPIANQW